MADATAIVGALTGSLGLALSLAQEWRHRANDRRELRVRAMVGHAVDLEEKRRADALRRITGERGEDLDRKPYLCFTLTNMGRRVIRVKLFGGSLANGQDFTGDKLSQGLPCSLDEGEEHHIVIPAVLFEGVSDITGFHAIDTTGTKWELHHVDFVAVQTSAREALAEWKKEQRISHGS